VIILENNPCYDDYHTWIRELSDIKTFEETFLDDDYIGYNNFMPDYHRSDAEKALLTGEITVYSSYPIEQGTFVTPSRMEAEGYSGTGKVYSKRVKLTDVAWIDITQEQYAKVEE